MWESCTCHDVRQVEFRPVWASGEHEATGSSSCRSPAPPDCMKQTEVTLPGVNMINTSCTLIYLGWSLQHVYLVNYKAGWATLRPSSTHWQSHTHSAQHLCDTSANCQEVQSLLPPWRDSVQKQILYQMLNIILNLILQDLIRIATDAVHTIQSKHLQIAIVLNQHFRNVFCEINNGNAAIGFVT